MKTQQPNFETATTAELCDYFIAKFTAIPAKEWIVWDYIDNKGRCCALGHCGYRNGMIEELRTEEGKALCRLLGSGCKVAEINNGEAFNFEVRPDPKAKTRIISSLCSKRALT